MAGDRLEHWSTLSRDKLTQRVLLERQRIDLSFADQQLFNAAQDRLLNWREPRRRTAMNNDIEEAEQAEPKKERKMRVAKKAAKPVKAAKAVTKSVNNGRGRGSKYSLDAKVIKTGVENPLREGTGGWERIETIIKSSGQSVKTVRNKTGIKPSTLGSAVKLGVVKIVD